MGPAQILLLCHSSDTFYLVKWMICGLGVVPLFLEHVVFTLPETNIAPENGWLEYYVPIGEAYLQRLR